MTLKCIWWSETINSDRKSKTRWNLWRRKCFSQPCNDSKTNWSWPLNELLWCGQDEPIKGPNGGSVSDVMMTRPCAEGVYVYNIKHQEWFFELHMKGVKSVTRKYDIIGFLFQDNYQSFQEFVLNKRHLFQSRVVFL